MARHLSFRERSNTTAQRFFPISWSSKRERKRQRDKVREKEKERRRKWAGLNTSSRCNLLQNFPIYTTHQRSIYPRLRNTRRARQLPKQKKTRLKISFSILKRFPRKNAFCVKKTLITLQHQLQKLSWPWLYHSIHVLKLAIVLKKLAILLKKLVTRTSAWKSIN